MNVLFWLKTSTIIKMSPFDVHLAREVRIGRKWGQRDKMSENFLEKNSEKLPVNEIIQGDCVEVMKKFPDNCIDLVVTSPPYGVGKDYEDYTDFFCHLEKLFDKTIKELYRIVVQDGRIAFNLPHAINTESDEIETIIPSFLEFTDNYGFNLREWIIWVKDLEKRSTSTAWGSWCSPSNPHLANGQACESIFVLNKGGWKKEGEGSDLTKSEFIDWTNNVWLIKNEFDKEKHPAPFPSELPKRLIKLYSFKGSVVLDPFCGSGTTCLVTKRLNRDYIGIDISEEYCKVARDRLKQENMEAFC